ncbi:MAG: UDP-2,3-diacylglucosamine diphosphatase, partial [Bdellovibrionales bacterium]
MKADFLNHVIKTNDDGRKIFNFRDVFISDIHWGTHASRAKALCRALTNIQTQNLTLVGDIADFWHMSQKDTWGMGPYHRQGIAHILRMRANKIYIPGNHEDTLRTRTKTFPQHGDRDMVYRNLIGGSLFGIEVVRDSIYTDPNGKRYFVCHGDEFDP